MTIEVKDVLKKVSRKKSGGSKKIGRSTAKCKRYRDEGRKEKNKVRRVLKESKRQERMAVHREKRRKAA